MKVGCIGVGRMGSGIAGRVLGGGHELRVYDRAPEKCAALGAAGAEIAPSIARACEDREVVISMLTDDAALHEVAFSAGGLRETLPRGAVHLAMGTHGVTAMRALGDAHAAADQVLVAAPVLGRPDMAASGQLGIVAAGPAQALARCRPLLELIGRRTFEAGADPVGACVLKLANNFMIGCALESMAEAHALARKFGVAPALLHEVLTGVSFSAPVFKIYGQLMVDQAYDGAGFTTQLALKDANLVQAAAEAGRSPMPMANVVRDKLLGAIAHGDGERDWAVLAREQARASGLE